jgi:F0F1-type ATP synthase assembly protein I
MGRAKSEGASVPEQRPNPRELGFLITISQVGLEMMAPVVAGWLLGVWIDWHPWPLIVGAVLGLVIGVAHLVVLQDRANKQDSSGKDAP